MKVELNDAGLMVRVDLGVIYHDAGSLLAAIFSGGIYCRSYRDL